MLPPPHLFLQCYHWNEKTDKNCRGEVWSLPLDVHLWTHLEKPAQETPPPGSDSAVRRFTELGPSPKPETGWREERGKRALVNTSGPGQCPWNLGGTGPHAPGSCDRCFLDLSGPGRLEEEGRHSMLRFLLSLPCHSLLSRLQI